MSEKRIEIKEKNQLIAKRVPPGDRWTLINDQKQLVHESLTETLEAYFQTSNFRGEFRLNPLESTLSAIHSEEVVIEPVIEKPKEWGIYGELNFKQGI